MNKAIISAPFGIYIRIPGCTSTRGTYTYERRPGAIWGALTRIHFPYPWQDQGISNNMGMRNPGIKHQNFTKHPDDIWSVAGLHYLDWVNVLLSVPQWATVELNFSCPNVKQVLFPNERKMILKLAADRFDNVIVKLPADFMAACNLFDAACTVGIQSFHCCNTVKMSKGGVSGRAIQEYSLPVIKMIKREDPNTTVIGGGGIYTPDDVKRYRDVGTDHFALGAIFFMPWKIPAVLKEINK